MLKTTYIIAIAIGVAFIFASLLTGPVMQMPLLLIGCSALYFLLTVKDKILPETKDYIRNPLGLFFVLSVLLSVSYILFGTASWIIKLLVGILMLTIIAHRYWYKKRNK